MKQKVLITILILVGCITMISACGKVEKQDVSCSEDDYIWDNNIIVSLSEEGMKKKNLEIPERCEGFSNLAFANIDSNVECITFESDKDIKLGGAFMMAQNITNVELPDQLTEIPAFAFWGCGTLKTITIPSGVVTIDESAFEGDTNLEEVTFAGNVQEIGKAAFKDCTTLKKLKLPDSVYFCGEYAFSGCSALEKVELSSKLTEVGEGVFYECTALKKIIVPKEMQLKTYTSTSLAQIELITFSKDGPTVKVVKNSWADKNYDLVFGNLIKKYHI